jgi:hypothetical protein
MRSGLVESRVSVSEPWTAICATPQAEESWVSPQLAFMHAGFRRDAVQNADMDDLLRPERVHRSIPIRIARIQETMRLIGRYKLSSEGRILVSCIV